MSATPAPQSGVVQPAFHQIVFVDTSIHDYQSILAGIASGTEIVLIDGHADGLAQIAAELAGRSGIDAVHIFSHGSDGHVDLGSTRLDADNVNAYGDVLANIGRALSADADILLYGCDVAAARAARRCWTRWRRPPAPISPPRPT